jgi:DNA-binding transcriptional LysR family regulator
MDSLRGIESFVRSVELGSIAAAARQLGISAAAASQNIARLERDLGVRLLQRTTRRLGLTDSGQVYFERVRHVVHDLETAATAVSALNDMPRGRLIISASVAFGRHVIAPLIPGFSQLYPQLSIELVVTDRAIDHIAEGIDISVRFAEQLEPSLIARRLVTVPMLICASPDYLARRGTPQTPQDLVHHDCLVYRFPVHGRLFRWTFLRDGTLYEPDIKPKIVSNDIDTLASMAVSGAGIARLGAFLADQLVETGRLVSLFGGKAEAGHMTSAHTPFTYYACTLDRHSATPKIRAFIDYAVEALKQR